VVEVATTAELERLLDLAALSLMLALVARSSLACRV
jgi:hypothetical protein